MNEQSEISAEELERLGDEALAAGQLEDALRHYREAHRLILDVLDPVLIQDAGFDVVSTITDDLSRVGTKANDLCRTSQPPPKSAAERAAELRAAVDESMETGDLADASHLSFRLGAGVLRCVGRDAEADSWQADADKYEDWEWFMDQEIPGHVHLWDIRIDLSDRLRDDE